MVPIKGLVRRAFELRIITRSLSLFAVFTFGDVVQFSSGYDLVIYAWLCGVTAHAALHFIILPTATKLWDFALGPDR